MSKLTILEVEHIAKLSRLDLSTAEKEKFANQLSGVLEYIGQLNEVDTSNVDPTAQVTDLSNVFVEDRVSNAEDQFDLLNNAPETEGTAIKIPAVFDNE